MSVEDLETRLAEAQQVLVQKEWRQAKRLFQRLLNEDETLAVAWQGLGTAQFGLNDKLNSIVSFRKLADLQPHVAYHWLLLGTSYYQTGRLEKALRCSKNALQIDQNLFLGHRLKSSVEMRMGLPDDAVRSCQKALEIHPDDGQARTLLAIMKLATSGCQDGWDLYEARHDFVPTDWSVFAARRWSGESLDGKTILLLTEQGLGDSLQFARYAAVIKERYDCEVWLFGRTGLLPLMQSLQGVDRLFGNQGAPPSCDFYLPVMSIPRFLDVGLIQDNDQCPYLQADPELRKSWKQRLDALPGALKVGLVWRGNPEHEGDHFRSLNPEDFAALGRWNNVSWVSLQKDASAEEIQRFAGNLTIYQFDELDQAGGIFQDTAALIDGLDLVISVDTAIAHLAGALDRPIWMLLAKFPDWRWGLDGDRTDWYTSMRLFRQERSGDWEAVIEAVSEELGREFNQPAKRTPSEFQMAMRGNRVMVAARHGYFLANQNDRFVGRSMLEYGEWSEQELRVLFQLVAQDSVIVEAGANIGTHTIPLAKAIGPLGRIYAFEPQTEFFQTLCANLALNGLGNANCVQAALGQQEGEVFVPKTEFSELANHSGLSLSKDGGEYSVPIKTIDSLELGQLHLIKADVQGFEREVVVGGIETIRRCKPQLYLENEDRAQSSGLIELLWELGYDAYWHFPRLYLANNHFRNEQDLFPNIVSTNVLAVHREHNANMSGFQRIEKSDEWLLPE